MPEITAIILTFNEELHIERAIKSLRRCPAVTAIYVVDSHSTDNTRLIAEALGAHVVKHEFVNQAKQLQWALDALPITTDWIMRLDADEVIGDDLAQELAAAVKEVPNSVGGFTLNRRHIFLGKWIRYGGRFPLKLLRVWRTGHGRVEDRWMDEHVVLRGGSILDLEGRFEDRNLFDLHYFTQKHNSYAMREALEVLMTSYGQRIHDEAHYTLPPQARFKRLVKERIYNRLPYQFTSFAYFVYRYFVQLGFLDGRKGLSYHFLQGFWYRFLVGAKTEELRSKLVGLPNDEMRLVELERIAHRLTTGSATPSSSIGEDVSSA